LEKAPILERFSFFRDATTEMRATLESAAMPVTVPPGAFFFREGDRCEQLALVGRGSLRVFKIGATGREITLYHVQSGETCLINMLSLFTGTPTHATALVEAPLEALVFPRPLFLEWLRTSDVLRRFAFESMAQRLVDVMTLVEEIAFGKMDLRLAVLLRRRFENSGLPLRALATTHDEIASELGTAREVVSRLLKEFERLGAIETSRGRILLLSEERLRRLGQAAESPQP
jgi:CRP/FNR family transcriptional regulator, anaerobic regulatory protein